MIKKQEEEGIVDIEDDVESDESAKEENVAAGAKRENPNSRPTNEPNKKVRKNSDEPEDLSKTEWSIYFQQFIMKKENESDFLPLLSSLPMDLETFINPQTKGFGKTGQRI